MTREDFKTGLDQTTCTEDDQGMAKITEVGQDMILIIEVVTYVTHWENSGFSQVFR